VTCSTFKRFTPVSVPSEKLLCLPANNGGGREREGGRFRGRAGRGSKGVGWVGVSLAGSLLKRW
jgi:hypothetical protein